MKADSARIARALAAPPPELRLFLLHGPDEAGSCARLAELARGMGAGAERIDLAAAELKADPARLADEAAAISLFGASRYIVVDPAGEECVAAVAALLEASEAGNPVALVAGPLRASSKLLKAALASPAALAFASYLPGAREAVRLVREEARAAGLGMNPDVARRIADAAGGNRALIAREIAKLALYADADPARPRDIDHDAIDAVGADAGEGDLGRLVVCVAGGRPAELEAELVRLAGVGIEGIPLLRAVLRRMLLLARLRAEVDRGESVDKVMASSGKSLFWKEKDGIARQLARWRSPLLARAVERLQEAQRAVMAPDGLGPRAADEELFAIARQAQRLR
ncbi:MAG: DNA polymerase III subunit delta [Sphingomonadaceae bacterium]